MVDAERMVRFENRIDAVAASANDLRNWVNGCIGRLDELEGRIGDIAKCASDAMNRATGVRDGLDETDARIGRIVKHLTEAETRMKSDIEQLKRRETPRPEPRSYLDNEALQIVANHVGEARGALWWAECALRDMGYGYKPAKEDETK